MKCIGKWVPGDIKCAMCTVKSECQKITVRGGNVNVQNTKARRDVRH